MCQYFLSSVSLLKIAGYVGYVGYIFLYLICRLLSDKWWPGCEVKTENQNKLNSLIRFLLNQWIILVTLDTIEDAGHHSWPAVLKYIIFPLKPSGPGDKLKGEKLNRLKDYHRRNFTKLLAVWSSIFSCFENF